MRFPSYISRSRHGVYYLRVVTPKAVQQANPKFPKELRKSLNTRCPREAAVRSRHMALDWQILIAEITNTMSKDEKYNSKMVVHVHPDGGISYRSEETDTAERSKEHIRMLRELGVIPANSGVMGEMGHDNPTAKEYRETKLDYIDIKVGGSWLSEIIEAFAEEKFQTNQWNVNTWEQTYKPLLRDFREIVSAAKRTVTDKDGVEKTFWDISSKQLAEEHIQIYCAAMFKFPKNYGSIKNVGDAKQALNSGLPPQDRSNAFKKIRMIKTFLLWAYKKRKLSQQLDELLMTEKLDKKRDRSKEGYQPWTPNELKLIFERTTYSTDTAWKFWTPILGLYTGARANELAQLLVSDVITANNIPCISITDLDEDDDDAPISVETTETHRKSVKTAASRRWVPIHPKLIELGFLRFIDSLKEQGETRLFPDLPYVIESGYGRKVSRFFAESTKKLGIWVSRKKVFHSFRSTLNGRLMSEGMPQELREFVLGHTNESMNVQKYGKQLSDRPYDVLLSWMTKVDFGLEHQKWEPAIAVPEL